MLDAGDLLLLGVMHDRLARGEQALGIGIAGRIRQVADHVLLDFFRRLEAERRKIADIELDDAVAVFFHLPGARHHRAADVVADIGQLGGFQHGTACVLVIYVGAIHNNFPGLNFKWQRIR